MNSVQLIGNLTRDPDIRFTKTGIAVTRFTLACTDTYKKQDGTAVERTNYPSVKAWDKWGEYAGNNLKKGDHCFVVGTLQTGSYEKDGHKVYTTEVNATLIAAPAVKRSQNQSQKPAAPGQGFSDMGEPVHDDDIPF